MNSVTIELNEEEKQHFYRGHECGEMVDGRQLDGLVFHEHHVRKPDTP